MAKMNNAQGAVIEFPDRENLTNTDEGHGFTVGQRVEFTRTWAADVPAGTRAVIVRIDDHPIYPLTVDIHNGASGMIFGCPVAPSEVAPVVETPDPAPAAAGSAPEGAEGDAEPEAVAA